jgi:hypothetical protein
LSERIWEFVRCVPTRLELFYWKNKNMLKLKTKHYFFVCVRKEFFPTTLSWFNTNYADIKIIWWNYEGLLLFVKKRTNTHNKSWPERTLGQPGNKSPLWWRSSYCVLKLIFFFSTMFSQNLYMLVHRQLFNFAKVDQLMSRVLEWSTLFFTLYALV